VVENHLWEWLVGKKQKRQKRAQRHLEQPKIVKVKKSEPLGCPAVEGGKTCLAPIWGHVNASRWAYLRPDGVVVWGGNLEYLSAPGDLKAFCTFGHEFTVLSVERMGKRV
jgi:hypothetical protein